MVMTHSLSSPCSATTTPTTCSSTCTEPSVGGFIVPRSSSTFFSGIGFIVPRRSYLSATRTPSLSLRTRVCHPNVSKGKTSLGKSTGKIDGMSTKDKMECLQGDS